MAVTKHTNKDKTVSWQVRVGSKPAKWFNEKSYGSRKLAHAEALKHEAELLAGGRVVKAVTCEAYADRLLVHLERERLKSGRQRKRSTLNVAKTGANGFKRKWGGRLVASIERGEARDWALDTPAGQVSFAVQLFNRATEEGLRPDNPFKGLKPSTRGRSDDAPPTTEEFQRLLDGCAVLGDYGPHFRAFLTFAGFSGLRPGEIFALEWDDIDFAQMLVHVRRRLYEGELDLPKSNQQRTVVLLPQARDALLPLERVARTVFVAKRGGGLTQSKLSLYWAQVKAQAGVDFDPYHATKHRFVHEAYVVKGISPNAIAQQMGWSREAVDKLLRVYGHGDVGWRDEWRRAYADNVTSLRAVGE